MNIPSLPPAVTASIAGLDRAAAEKVALSSAPTTSVANSTSSETVDSIDKGNASEDSGADGRQTLDTFERRQPEENERLDDASDAEITVPPLPSQCPTLGVRLDFTA